MSIIRLAATAAVMSYAFSAAPTLAQSVGSASFLTHRSCAGVSATTGCPTIFPAHRIATSVYGGGVGVGGFTGLDVGGGNIAWSNVTLGAFDLPLISAYSAAPGDTRMNANVFAFQSYLNTSSATISFSISGGLHIVDSSGSPTGDQLLPQGAGYSAYLGIWDPSILTGSTTAEQLFTNLFYAGCDVGGVLATAGSGGGITTVGEQDFSLTTNSCAGTGTIDLAPGQEVLVVAGLQIPVNRGGFIDASRTFSTRFGDDLTSEQVTQITSSVQSAVSRGAAFAVVAAVPETSTWAMLIVGFGAVGATLRRRSASIRTSKMQPTYA